MNVAGGQPRPRLWERIARILFALFPPSYRERHAAPRQALTEQLLESEPDPGRRSRLARGVAFDALRTLPLAWLRASVSTVGDDDDDDGIPSFSLLDWKLGLRMLIKDPVLSLIGGFALACVIGVGGGVFHVAQQFWFSDMGLEEGREIVRLERRDFGSIPVEEFVVWREKLSEIVDLSGWLMSERALFVRAGESGAMTESPVAVAEVTASTFPLTRTRPFRGRVLTEADEGAGAPPVIVVGYEMWQNRLGADPNIIGREVQLGEQSVTVVGVMPPGFAFPVGAQAWTPLHLNDGPDGLVRSFGRLAPSASLESAQAELLVVGAQTAAERSRGSGQLVTPRTGDFAQEPSEARVRRFGGRSLTSTNGLATLSAVLVFILCMTAVCASVAILQFARTAKREAEIVVRNALGASRGRIAGQLFVEALVLSLVSAVVGLAGVQVLIRHLGGPLKDLLPPLPPWWSDTLEIETVVAAGGLAVLAAAMVAVLPAIIATGEGMNEALKSRAAGGASLRFGGVWSVIIVCQVAITVMCLPFGVGFAHGVWLGHVARESFPAERYLSFLLFYPQPGRERPDSSVRAALYEELARRLAMEPGFEGITYGSGLAGMDHSFYSGLEIELTGAGNSVLSYPPLRYTSPKFRSQTSMVASVDVHYFETFELPVVAGRALEAADVGASNHPILVNESFARFLGERPLGTRIRFPPTDYNRDYYNVSGDEPLPWLEVVGVVRNVGTDANTRRPKGGIETEDRKIYRLSSTVLTEGGSVWVAVKTVDPSAFAPRLRAVAAQLGPDARLTQVAPLDVELRQEYASVYFAAFASASGVLLCILLCAAGVTAVMTVSVAARTREVGIRLAIGASKRAVCATLFGRAAWQLVLGSVIGSALFVLVETQVLNQFQGPVLEPLLTVAWVMILVGLIACALPAQHALRIHPLDAIRE